LVSVPNFVLVFISLGLVRGEGFVRLPAADDDNIVISVSAGGRWGCGVVSKYTGFVPFYMSVLHGFGHVLNSVWFSEDVSLS